MLPAPVWSPTAWLDTSVFFTVGSGSLHRTSQVFTVLSTLFLKVNMCSSWMGLFPGFTSYAVFSVFAQMSSVALVMTLTQDGSLKRAFIHVLAGSVCSRREKLPPWAASHEQRLSVYFIGTNISKTEKGKSLVTVDKATMRSKKMGKVHIKGFSPLQQQK